jgi:hypothetical protein
MTLVVSPISRVISSFVPTLTILPSFTATASAQGCDGFMVKTLPLVKAKSADTASPFTVYDGMFVKMFA